MSIARVLIANRGAVGVRIERTLRELGIESVAVYADQDRDSLHVSQADTAVALGPGPAQATYLDMDALLAIARDTGAHAVHPGYGFLSESPAFCRRLEAAGIAFLGPAHEQIEDFGNKHRARQLAAAAEVPVLPGSGMLADRKHALQEAAAIGYPVMLKSAAGGGGIGMERCDDAAALGEAFERVQRLARASFGDASLFLEKLVLHPRHVEVQAFGDGHGGVLIVGDRDCSVQRRRQKVIEECPAPGLPGPVRAALHDAARRLLASVAYRSAGTVEFLYDPGAGAFYFLEVNTRLQVEHGVTEAVYGIDLVRWMVLLANGTLPPIDQLATEPRGHSIQARVYAEDPAADFRPTPGLLDRVSWPDGVRVDTWVSNGCTVPAEFDPLLAKIISHSPDRDSARAALIDALHATELIGVETNLDYLKALLHADAFATAQLSTATFEAFPAPARGIEVLQGGLETTLQAYPGRQGYWSVGVPPSGPMDDLSLRLGNRLLGNAADAPGLECTLTGPTLRFREALRCVLSGAPTEILLNGQTAPMWQVLDVPAGAELRIGTVRDGARAYLSVANGFRASAFLGSSATFTLGALGGLNGRRLRTGDVLHTEAGPIRHTASAAASRIEPMPDLSQRRRLRITLGPHDDDSFFEPPYLDELLQATWTVHHNSSRTGVRLIGPKPRWSRSDGGEAGLHPSNLHDNAYAFAALDFTGDQLVILGPDGPSLGGFACPAAVIPADHWKLGQLSAGDTLTFLAVSENQASAAQAAQDAAIEALEPLPAELDTGTREASRLLGPQAPGEPEDAVVRRAGQDFLLVEFGPPLLDLDASVRAHRLASLLAEARHGAILEWTPGIRSLQVRWDSRKARARDILQFLQPLLTDVSRGELPVMPSREVHLPLSWDDPACRQASERYEKTVRPGAPWCPDNIEFIRRINGLTSREDVHRILFDAEYLVLGLGDVYLGAPVAVPIDPRHRLVTTKYNPARTWTAENSVGIGGAYLCVYGLEGPGGYQFVGRTVQVWNRKAGTPPFDEHWLLRPFDRIRFYPVAADELMAMREAFPRGELELDIRDGRFSPQAQAELLAREQDSIAAFRATRQAAFDAELDHWRATGQDVFEEEESPATRAASASATNGTAVESPLTASVWSLPVAPGSQVDAGDTIAVLEAMKTEINVPAPCAGTLVELLVAAGQQVPAGSPLAVIQP